MRTQLIRHPTAQLLNCGPADRNRVNVYEQREELYWGEKLCCTGEQLRAAVDAVGMKTEEVKAYLEKMRRRTTAVRH